MSKKKNILQYCGIHLHKEGFTSYYDLIKYYNNKWNCNSFQIFLSSPYSLKYGPSIEDNDISLTKKYIKSNNIHLVCHGGYLLNFSNPSKKLINVMIKNIIEELTIMNKLGGIGVIIHMGKTVEKSYDDGLEIFIANLKIIIQYMIKNHIKCKLILENSAHQGTEIGYTIQQIQEIYNAFTITERKYIGFCIDSCHLFQAGYDIRDEKVIKQFFKYFKNSIGINKLLCIHINDSKNELNEHIDRHENIFAGKIGKDLDKFINISTKYKVPMILETPKKDLIELNKLKNSIV
jgi:deoxyribonuclease-4